MAGSSVFVLDDERSVRDLLSDLLSPRPMEVKVFETAQELLDALDNGSTADCIISDVNMPGISGLELVKALATRNQDIPVVLITGYGDVPMAVQAMKMGAADFIEKPFTFEEIVQAIDNAAQKGGGQGDDSAEIAERYATLTQREQDTFRLIALGHTNKSAAAILGISHRTVEVHRARIMEKMMATTLPELVRMSLALEK